MSALAGLPENLLNVVKMVLAGSWKPENQNYRVVRHAFHHRLAYLASGTATEYNFFQTDPTNAFVGNLRATGLPNDQLAILRSLSLKVETGYNVAGTIIGSNGGDQVGAVATVFPLAEAIRKIYENGIVDAVAGDWKFIRGIHGLYNFPAGGGADISLGGNGTAPVLGAVVNNGSPANPNRFEFPAPVILFAQKPLKLDVKFQTAISPAVDCVFKASFEADLIFPANA